MKRLCLLMFAILFFSVSCDGGRKIVIGQKNDSDSEVSDVMEDSDSETSDESEQTDNEKKDEITPTDKDPVDNEVQDEKNDNMINDNMQDSQVPDEDNYIPECTKDIECAIDGGPCIEGYCNELGKCDTQNVKPGTPCSDGEFCNGDDECDGNGACLPVGTDPCDGTICREENGGQCCDPGFSGNNCSECVRFVQQGVSVAADGLKWATAFGTLNDAHDSAKTIIEDGSNSIDSCKIWIKEGTYAVPSTTEIISQISIVGGFKGNGGEMTVNPDLTVLDASATTMDNVIAIRNASNVMIDNLTVKGNVNNGSEDNYGGGIYVGSSTDIVLENIKFIDNSAIGATASNKGFEGKGGALALIESDVSVMSCVFTNNLAKNGENEGYGDSTAGAFGGAVYVSSGSVVISDSQFSGNNVQEIEDGSASGGAVFAYAPDTLTIENCTFDSNVSQTWGGALRVEKGEILVTDCTFTGNSASGNGGAVELNDVFSSTFNSNTFSLNSANVGGAVHLSNGSDVTMEDCVFSENEATEVGAGLNANNSDVYAHRCKFIGNDCKGGSECRGGGFSVDDGATGELTNALIIKNHAKSYGAGVYIREDSEAFIFFSTIADNTTDGSSNTGSGIHNYDNSYTLIMNTIIWGNSPGAQIQNNSGSDADVEYSIIQGGWSGDGNFDTDPLFVDTANNNYKPGSGSDAIDNALNDPGNTDKDIDGGSRPKGSGYDIGCYEL